MERSSVVLAGGTGDLGGRIAAEFGARGAAVRALVRGSSGGGGVARLRSLGVEIVEVEFDRPADLARACEGGSCVVSALSGLEEVIVGAQTRLLDAATAAGVPRFIPSDYSIDFTRLATGSNRNLDLRRDFQERIDRAPIQATSVLCGMFADLLTGPAPVILFPIRRVLYWGDADQPLDFTTVADTAAFTAAAALDDSAPRFLRVAGDRQSARGLARAASEVTGQRFRLLRAGGLGRLRVLIRVTRTLAPGRREVFPAWQGMQYLHDMFTGRPLLDPLDNDRYPELGWTRVREVVAAR
jgi:nucleoside-diphosphate-sugar epimerase